MKSLNDNEKAAIAGRVWEPAQLCEGLPIGFTDARAECGSIMRHEAHPYQVEAPNMHDPANLWRALMNLTSRGMEVLFMGDRGVELTGRYIVEAPDFFAALVALYDAERL